MVINNKRNSTSFFASLALFLMVLCAPSHAGMVFAGFDTSDFDFDVVDYDPGSGSGLNNEATASGTSNGVNWSIGPTNLWTGRTRTNETFNFINSGINILGKSTDNLHTSNNFTVVFDRVVETLYVALGNDGSGNDSINLGLIPDQVQGLIVSGTQITLASGGQAGLAMFSNINSLTVSHSNVNALDGFDFAFHAQASDVSAPSLFAIFAMALAFLSYSKTRRV